MLWGSLANSSTMGKWFYILRNIKITEPKSKNTLFRPDNFTGWLLGKSGTKLQWAQNVCIKVWSQKTTTERSKKQIKNGYLRGSSPSNSQQPVIAFRSKTHPHRHAPHTGHGTRIGSRAIIVINIVVVNQFYLLDTQNSVYYFVISVVEVAVAMAAGFSGFWPTATQRAIVHTQIIGRSQTRT